MKAPGQHSFPATALFHVLFTFPLYCCTAENSSHTTNSYFNFPGVIDTTYSQLGDINIGAIFVGTAVSESYPSGACADDVTRPLFAFELPESIAFVTRLINRNPNLLPNVTLGFTIRISCSSVGHALGTSMAFLPRNKHIPDNESSPSDQNNHDVIGTLGPGRSSLAVTLSSLNAMAHLPMVGATEGGDELSNKDQHPYYFRVIPPNLYQVYAMLRFISSNGWSYISMVYAGDAYGQTAFDNLNRLSSSYGICVATSHRILHSTDYMEVVADLLAHGRARAVILFIYGVQFKHLLQATEDQNAVGHFVWLGSTSLIGYYESERENNSTNPALGAYVFEIFGKFIPEYLDYLQKQNVNNSKNPWMKQIWEYLFDCKFSAGTCDNKTSILESSRFQPRTFFSSYLDAMLTFAHAAHNLLADVCPDARGQAARACISGQLLRAYLKNTSFDGFLGRVEFDENQEVKGKYIISQFQYTDRKISEADTGAARGLVPRQVGIYDSLSDTIEYTDPLSWSHLNTLDERVVPWTEGSLPIFIPESVCSGPCSVGEYKIEKEVPCCWECRRCRDNERLVNGNTSCQACPQFTWPDPTSGFTACVDIPLTYSTLEDTIPLVLTALTLLVLVVYSLTFSGYVFYRNKRVIKASSKELSVIQLIAILAGYVNVLLFQIKPTQYLCVAIYFLFCMSFVLLYAPLLVKTIRIFRIFQSGKANNRQPHFINSQSQLFITGCLVLVQIFLCGASFELFSPGAKRTQPIWSQKLVELSCDLTLPGLASFLGYNIVLVSLCSIFAIKVRKLPDNFNESQFIAMCVATTMLIWLAFIPTYFTASREYVRVFLLSSALLLNHTVALAFLFLPRIYAAAFLPQETGKLSDGRA